MFMLLSSVAKPLIEFTQYNGLALRMLKRKHPHNSILPVTTSTGATLQRFFVLVRTRDSRVIDGRKPDAIIWK